MADGWTASGVESVEVSMDHQNGAIAVRIGTREYLIRFEDGGARVNGTFMETPESHFDAKGGVTVRHGADLIRAVFDCGKHERFLIVRGREFPVEIETERDRLMKRFGSGGSHRHSHSEIRASMPGMVVRIPAEVGRTVDKGEAILILEAMKMENEVRAPSEATVRAIHVVPGQTVEKGDLLMDLD